MTLQYKRKRKGKTDYNKRRKLVGSRELRLVVRKSNRNINIQLVKYEEAGDKVLIDCNTRQLIKYGWKGARGNIPAAYLAGLLLARKAKKQNIKKAILDIGMHMPMKGGVIYGALKGAIDGGLEIPHSEEVLPSQERLEGKHIMLNTKTKYTKSDREKTSTYFNEAKNKILKE